MTIGEFASETAKWLEPELGSVFTGNQLDDVTVKAAMYSLNAGGKRLRPLMMRLTALMTGCPESKMADVLYYAATLEMIHTYSLIHDDLPAMDNDDLRRGKPTCHKVYGEGIATLAGDLLLNTACERLFKIAIAKPEYLYASYFICKNAGLEGMVGGQSIDLDSEGKTIGLDLLYELQEKKTGALIESAVVTPYYLIKGLDEKRAEEDETAGLLRKLAGHVGLAFQIRDDILDVESDPSILGKNTGKDLRDSKATFVTLLGREGAAEKLSAEITAAMDVLSSLEGMGYDTDGYKALIDYLEKRDS
ncbi:MAG: polyprenyl synthetase family protein [Clostridiales bacterium]|nr:polyprenyl synthetase family protein [Clostridiales bacterium]